MSAADAKRLYESLDTVAAALPAELSGGLMKVWRQRACRLDDTESLRVLRARIFGALPEIVLPDWYRSLSWLPDDDGADLLDQWKRGAGYCSAARKGKR